MKNLLDELPNLGAEQLELLVRHHNKAYFELNAPEITDEEFDKLVGALRLSKPDSVVLDELGSTGTIRHSRPMLSLDKCYDDDAFFKWREKIQGSLIAMPKIDGVACSIHYNERGQLFLAATRGDGQQGEDITDNVKQIASIPKQISSQGHRVEVRGEVYMTLSRFTQHYQDQFVNPRNLAAGALKQKDAKKSAAYALSFFPYDLIGTPLSTEEQKFVKLEELGFLPPPIEVLVDEDACKLAYAHYAMMRPNLDYDIDGVVFRANQTSEQGRLGVTAHHPRWTMAYKFQGDSAQTELLDVKWSVARTAAITPVAVVKPVFVSGATVTHASLHNYGLFQKHVLTRGALVEIVRRGGVIPHLERVLRRSEDYLQAPKQCPSCGGEVVVDGDFLKCAQPFMCHDVVVRRFSYFCTALDIQGFGEKLIRTLVEHHLLVKLGDLFRLTQSQLISLDRVGPTLAKKLISEIDQKREIEWSQFLSCLGFEEIGPTVSERVTAQFQDLNSLRQASQEDLSQIDGIGESIASSLTEHLIQFHDEIDDLLTQVQIKKPTKIIFSTQHPLCGKSVVFTGTMKRLERKEAQKQVRAVGGHTPSTVSMTTDYLVIGEEAKKSSKQKTAESYVAAGSKLCMISEDEFIQVLNSSF